MLGLLEFVKVVGLVVRRNDVTRIISAVGFLVSLVGLLVPLQPVVDTTTVGFALLLGVLFTAIYLGGKPALAASLVAMLGYNFFFLPPVRTLNLRDPKSLVALAAFSLTAVVTGQLSAKARAREAESLKAKRESERLYRELQSAFEKASEAEGIKRSELMKSALLDAVTHDLRTPLTSIRAAATTLLKANRSSRTLDPELSRELIEVVDQESAHLDQIISNFVELARIEAGDLTLKPTWGSLRDVAQAAIKRAGPLLVKHPVRLDIPDSLPLMHIDVRALAEVIYTLLDNAQKYSPDNSEISIAAGPVGSSIEVCVSDQGNGILAADRDRVFEKFYRGKSALHSRTSHPGGLGIGLSIAKSIVEAHRGAIWVGDAPRQSGTRVTFRIPIREG